MDITPIEFLEQIAENNSEEILNKKSSNYIDPDELKLLTSKRYGHTVESATKHLLTDYSNGFTICGGCGSFYHLGKGFTKHISDGCLNCEGEEKHRVYHVNASPSNYGGFPARYMSVMFDDGMSYSKDKLEVGKYEKEVEMLK